MKLLLKRVFLCVSAVGSAHAGWAQDWEHIRVIVQRLGLPRVVNIGSPPSQTIAIGDFDGDGDADIAVSGAGARRVTVLLGDASSPFTASLVAPRTDWPTERSTSLTLPFGDAQGRFSTLRMIDVGVLTAPAGLAAGDINDDGVSDVALLSDSDTGSVLVGDGAGGLVPMAHMTVGRSPPAATPAPATTSAPPAVYQGIATLTLNPTIAGGSGAASTGTITLNAPAPAGGVGVRPRYESTQPLESIRTGV